MSEGLDFPIFAAIKRDYGTGKPTYRAGMG